MIVWRLTPQGDVATALDGEGARLLGGRWNREGTPAMYTSDALALAVLEILVHAADSPALPERPLYAYRVDVPDERVERLEIARLPHDWAAYPAPPSTIELGTAWARRRESLALAVPSAVVHGLGWNVVINPLHPLARTLQVEAPVPFRFGERLPRRRR